MDQLKNVCLERPSNISRCERACIPDPPDSELQATFEQFSQEKSGSNLSATEQLDQLNLLFPHLQIKWETT